VGLLNGDDVPDFVLRTTTEDPTEVQHHLTFYLSATERKDGALWIPVDDNTVVRFCK
jgi:hypothetical protein